MRLHTQTADPLVRNLYHCWENYAAKVLRKDVLVSARYRNETFMTGVWWAIPRGELASGATSLHPSDKPLFRIDSSPPVVMITCITVRFNVFLVLIQLLDKWWWWMSFFMKKKKRIYYLAIAHVFKYRLPLWSSNQTDLGYTFAYAIHVIIKKWFFKKNSWSNSSFKKNY